jgi:ABC-type glycerol-3-phosphate transport system substrate-binding protein
MFSGRHIIWGVCLLLVCATGCGKETSLFDNAQPRVKAVWDDAVKLDKADKYMDAAETYDKLLHMPLTPEQATEVQMTVGRMYARMNRAASNGDREAQKVVDRINENKKAHP